MRRGRAAAVALGPLLVAVALAPFLAGGCGNGDGPAAVRQWRVAVRVADHLDGSPRTDVDLLLVDAEANRPLQGPLAADAAGEAVFDPVPAGHYAVIAFPGRGLELWTWPGSFRLPPPAPSGDGWPGPPGGSAPPPFEILLPTRDVPAPDGLPRISGKIVDAVSGDPVPLAMVHPFGSIDAYLGVTSLREDVSDAEGRFRVREIPFLVDPVTGRQSQAIPLVVEREGYRPRTWATGTRPAGSSIDIVGARIELEPLAGVPTGALTGRVLFRQEPVPGLPVGLIFAAEAPAGAGVAGEAAAAGRTTTTPCSGPDKARLGQPGAVTRTAGDGRFLFTAVPVGWWLAHPGFLDDDGYLVVASAAELSAAVTAGDTVRTLDLPVVRTIPVLAPAPGATVADGRPAFAWGAVAEADSYLVFVDGRAVALAGEPAWSPPPGTALRPGSHFWGVEAYDADRRPVGLTDYRPHAIPLQVPVPE